MEPAEIIAAITRNSESFTREALQSAIDQWPAVEPLLIQELDAYCDHPDRYRDDESFILPFVSLYLFAQFRCAPAIPAVTRFLRLPEEHVEFLLGDAVVEDLAQLLGSIFRDDPLRLRDLIDDPGVYQFVRGEALAALHRLHLAGLVPADALRQIIGDLLNGKLERKPSWLWEAASYTTTRLRFDEFRTTFETAKDQALVDCIDGDGTFNDAAECFLNDAIAGIENWFPFPGEEEDDFEESGGDDASLLPAFQPAVPHQREAPKIGRNDPCPCGSGKKFKKCCG